MIILSGIVLGALLAQEPGVTRIYRLMQGGAEVGRETYRRTATSVDRSVNVPVLNLKLDSRVEYDAAGRLARFSGQVYNASGDTLRNRFEAEVQGDSIVLTSGRAERRTRVIRARADGFIPAQSVSVVTEAAARAAGRDTVFHFLPMGVDSTFPVRVTHSRDTVTVDMAGVTAYLVGSDPTIRIPISGIVCPVWNGLDSLPPLAGLRPPVPNYDAPAGAPYTAEHVRVVIRPAVGDTFSLAGTLTLPVTGRRPFPAVVMMSGSGQQDRDENLWPILPEYRPFREFAERLAREGVAVLRYDDRTAGQSGGSVGGTTEDYTDDVRQLVVWLRARPEVDAARIGLVGHSEGGVMGPLLAARDPRIKAVVILAGPSMTGRDVVREQFTRPIEVAPGLSAADRQTRLDAVEGQLVEWTRANAWTRWFADYDPLPTARRLRMPVLIQHGALDRQVSVWQADTLAAAIRGAGNGDVTVKIYPRLNHLFLPTDGDGSPTEYMGLRQVTLPREVLDDTAVWLAQRLRR